MKSKLLAIALSVALVFPLAGCSSLQKAQKVSAVIEAVVEVAKAETSVVPAADQVAYTSFVTLTDALHTQLDACINSANGMTKGAKFLACFNGFAAGLNSPAELAQLRVLSQGSQRKVQLYLVGIIAGVNVAVSYFGGSPVAAPVLTQAPSAAELNALKVRVMGGL